MTVLENIPRGSIPPMTSPFDAEGELMLDQVAAQMRFFLQGRADGIAVGGSTGEGQTIDPEEFRDLCTAAVEASNGVPIIGGVIVDSTRDAVRRGKLVRDLKLAALQVTPVHYLFRPNDDSMVDHFRRIVDETGYPVIIYNVVPWTYLSPKLLARIMEEVPMVVGVKQSANDMKLLADLLTLSPDKLIYTALDGLLYPSYALGACGAIAAILAAVPNACADIWDAVHAGDNVKALERHNQVLGVWNAILADNLPACTRYAQQLQGVPVSYPRAPMPQPSEIQKEAIRAALVNVGAIEAK